MANTYSTIKTLAGMALETAAQSGGEKITLTQMAIGDGGGNATTPNEKQTALVREQLRVDLNAIAVNPEQSNQFTAEAIIPATSGGFTMREAGLYTSDGVLFAVANLPQVYKPSSSEGAFGQVVVTMTFQAANASEVNLSVDENVSVATRLWVENYVIPEHVFRGGTTGQFLAKSANDDGAWTWVDPSASVQVLVDTIEEDQTLASGQTAVTLSKVTANGLAVYVNGIRLEQTEWSKVDDTHITLNSARSAGDKITLVQNEQTGYSDVLRAARNLSDVNDADASLKNLSGLSTKGGRMEGLFAVDSGAVYVNGNASSNRQVVYQTDGKDRFSIAVDASSETGSNAGSAFRVSRFADDGTFIDAPLIIDRSTGIVRVPQFLSSDDNSDSVANTRFVQGGLTAVKNSLQSEASARQTADAGLQTQLNAKVSGSYGVASGMYAGKSLIRGVTYPAFCYNDGSADKWEFLVRDTDLKSEATARAAADTALSSGKLAKGGDAFTGDTCMAAHAFYAGSDTKSARLQFEKTDHISFWSASGALAAWFALGAGETQSYNVSVTANFTSGLSVSSGLTVKDGAVSFPANSVSQDAVSDLGKSLSSKVSGSYGVGSGMYAGKALIQGAAAPSFCYNDGKADKWVSLATQDWAYGLFVQIDAYNSVINQSVKTDASPTFNWANVKGISFTNGGTSSVYQDSGNGNVVVHTNDGTDHYGIFASDGSLSLGGSFNAGGTIQQNGKPVATQEWTGQNFVNGTAQGNASVSNIQVVNYTGSSDSSAYMQVATSRGVLAFPAMGNVSAQLVDYAQPKGSYVTSDSYAADFNSQDSRIIFLAYGKMIQFEQMGVMNNHDRVNFPRAFSNTPVVNISPSDDADTNGHSYTADNKGFYIHKNGGGTIQFNYTAFGNR